MKPNVLITRKLLPEALEYLRKKTEIEKGGGERNLSREETKQKIVDKEGLLTLLVERIDAEIIDAAPKIKLMKKEAILLNVARGPIVDERALSEALEKGEIWGAGLDVYEREPEIEERLLSLENVVLLPHIGSATYETRLKMAMTAAKNLVQGLRGEKPDNLVAN